ncbi:integumentary mucin C.1 [Drosophila eugracilis]|uniref:integumentary mucin C.1 n=1 Tax=Drosophila eugracilis TaxID=29029 RepID=UPI001BDA1AB7|nr:integumentary mucin C.1 [Drosophila eugracilis]
MWLRALISLLLVQYIAGTCNVCQSDSKVACHNETTFSVCYDGVPSYNFLSCPTDFYCTDGFYTCYLNADPVCKSEKETTTTEIPTTTTPTEMPTTTTTTEIQTTSTEISTTSSTTEIPTTTTTTEIPKTTTTTEIPSTTTTTEGPWNADDICQQATKNTFFENEDDPTCATYITCTVDSEGTHSTKITSCKANQYFSASLKVCTSTKPDGCSEVTTTTVATTTTVTTTTASTTTAEPWSAEETCSTVTKNTLFQNKDDPTCATYLYCYVVNDSTLALIKSCKTNQYYNVEEKLCDDTKPDYCT